MTQNNKIKMRTDPMRSEEPRNDPSLKIKQE